jgi:hypothetical protein
VHANFYDEWTDRQDENRRREKIQHKKGQTNLFSGLLKCHLKISYQANRRMLVSNTTINYIHI